MTAMTVPARPEEDASLRPVPWRRMAGVTWRQHRFALAGVAVFLGALAVCLWLAGLKTHHVYAATIAACQPPTSVDCGVMITTLIGTNGFLSNGFILQAVPVLIGAFVGAPVLARELETGTFRYAWTQGLGRRRWAVAKLGLLAVVVTAAAGAFGALLTWYYAPFVGNQSLGLPRTTPLTPALFDLRGVGFPAWTLAAFAIGALAGMLIRRVVPAIIATLAAYAGLAFAAGGYLREHYVAPIVTTRLDVFAPAWILSREWTKAGRSVSQSFLSQVLQGGGANLAGKGGVPQAIASWRYLVQHGYTQWTTYQPTNRFWPFQVIEGSWLLVLSVLLMTVTVWLVRRRLD